MQALERELRELNLEIKTTTKRYEWLLAEQVRTNDLVTYKLEISALESQFAAQHGRREALRSDSLLHKCASLDIEPPDRMNQEYWASDPGVLSPKGRLYVRQFFDAEKARRFEVKTLWVTKIILPLAAILVGIIGALTGLFAVLRHKP
jgi:hypothetical protein